MQVKEFNVVIERDSEGYFVASVPTLRVATLKRSAPRHIRAVCFGSHAERISRRGLVPRPFRCFVPSFRLFPPQNSQKNFTSSVLMRYAVCLSV